MATRIELSVSSTFISLATRYRMEFLYGRGYGRVVLLAGSKNRKLEPDQQNDTANYISIQFRKANIAPRTLSILQAQSMFCYVRFRQSYVRYHSVYILFFMATIYLIVFVVEQERRSGRW